MRGRPRSIDPPVGLLLKLPETVRARIDLILFSELEGRVPQGAYQKFFLERIADYFDNRPLDLTAYGIPGVIRGPKEIIDALERKLNGNSL